MGIVRTDVLRQHGKAQNTPRVLGEWMEEILREREYVNHTHVVVGYGPGTHYIILVTKDPS